MKTKIWKDNGVEDARNSVVLRGDLFGVKENMAEKIKQYILSLRFAYPRSIFDMSPADPAMLDVYEVKHRTTEEAFRADWQRVGECLGAAIGNFERERCAGKRPRGRARWA